MILLAATAFATTDTIGGDDTYADNGDMLKLVTFDVTESVVVTELEFAVYNSRSRSDITMVVYRADGDGWVLEGEAGIVDAPEDGDGWAVSDSVAWVLEAGQSYALGVWIGDDWYYFYDEGRTDDPSFGRATGSLQYECDAPEARISGDLERYYYWMQINSEDADVDGDGSVAATYGGGDCDDQNPGVNPEIAEVCDDGIDQDCSGADLPCDTTEPDDTGDTGTGDSGTGDSGGTETGSVPGDDGSKADGDIEPGAGACGCSSGGAGATPLLGLLFALAVRRRR